MNQTTSQLDFNALLRLLQRIAPSYSQNAFLPYEIAKRLLQRLQFIRMNPKTILDFSAKDGMISRELKNIYPEADIISHEYIPDFAKQASDLDWLITNHQQLPINNDSIDLIVSNLWLHNINDLSALFSEFYRILKPNGALFFTLFGPDTLQELRQSFHATSPYAHVQDFIDMHDIGDLLMHCQFSDPVMDMEKLTLTYATVSQLLNELKNMGATNLHVDRLRGLFGKNRYQHMIAEYDALRNNKTLPATFEIIYGHAWIVPTKSQGKMSEAGEFVISVDQLSRRRK